MKLPNGYGTVAKLSGNRRRPFVIREGQSGKHKVIGYAHTREEGYQILAEYNKEPWDYNLTKLTFKEIYQLWTEKRCYKLGKSNQNSLKSVYKFCHSIENKPYITLKAYHYQDCIDTCERGYATQIALKNLFWHLEKFALELDISSKNYTKLLTTESIPETKKTIFTLEERKKIWKHQNTEWIDSLLVFLYSGFRISELLDLKKENIDLKLGTMTGGCKTKAGKDRVVPIHSRIFPFVEERMYTTGEFLFSLNGKKCTDSQYRCIWRHLMAELEMEHTPHECRHTFRSLLDTAGGNSVCIDRLMGHKSGSIGERVYTHKGIDELKQTVELITD